MKELMNLNGIKMLSKEELVSISGGGGAVPCSNDSDCASVCGRCILSSGICIYPTNGCNQP